MAMIKKTFKTQGFKEEFTEKLNELITDDSELFVKDVINDEYYKVSNLRVAQGIDPDTEELEWEEFIIEVKKITDLGKKG